MKKLFAATVAVVLGLGSAGMIGATTASAHDHTDDITCSFASVDLTNYDSGATAEVTIDGASVHTGTFVGGLHINQALTFDATHTSHTLHTVVVSADGGYSFDHTKTTPENCYTPPVNVPILPAVFHPATCLSASTYDVPVQDARVKYELDSNNVRPVAGNNQPLADGVSVTIGAHVTAEAVQGGAAPNTYSITFTGQKQLHNASCVPAQTCHAVGAATHESDDNAGVLKPDGWHLYNNGNGKPTDVIFPAEGNLQGITGFTRNVIGTVGNGIFTRFIVDLSADGGSSYNSLSITDVTATQASIADVGSKNVFLGKTIAQIADLYPDAVYHAISFQTGSSYGNGEGAVLQGFSDGGPCTVNFTTVLPEPTHRTTTVTGEVTCTEGGVGGGSFPTTVTNFTSNGVWNDATGKYDMVETTDEGYPVTTYTETPASLESCPISATPVDPTVKTVCGTDDDITLASTDNIAYAITNQTKTGADVTATPADATVLASAAGWTIAEDGVGTFHVTYNNDACPVTLVVQKDGTLAFTGTDPTGIIILGSSFLLLGAGAFFSVRAMRRRDKAQLI